jgi:hypothetical protein
MQTWGKGLLLLALVLAACSDNGGGIGGGGGGAGGVGGGGVLDKEHSTGGSSWTVLVYMVGDNNLEPFALDDLNEMMGVGSGSGLNIVVQVDRADGYSSDPVGGLGDFTSTKRVLVQQGSLQELSDLGEVNMADPATLADFVTWGLKTYPADRTAIVFWDHGGGWGGFGVDEGSGGNLLHLPDIEQGLAQGRTGANNAKPFNVIGFDACLMATWEVALTMSAHGEYLIASEETEPGHGWDWTALSVLKQSPTTDPVTFGKNVIQKFIAQATTEKTVDSVTLALIDLYRLGTLGTAIDAVTKTFDGTAPLATAFARGQQAAQKYGDSPDPSKALNLVDLGNLVELTAKEASAVGAVQGQLNTALGQAVIDHAEGASKAGSKGLAIYFPPDSTYYLAAYDGLTAPASWRAFLKSYFGISNSSTGVPTFTNANKLAATGFSASGGLQVQGTLAGDSSSVARASLQYGLVNGTDLVVLGESPADVSGTLVGGEWDLSVLTLTQGTNTGFGYATVSAVGTTKVELDILFAYQKSSTATAQSCVRQLVFTYDAQGDVTLTSDAYYVDTAGAFGELNPAAGSLLIPVVKTISTTTGDVALEAGTSTPFTATAGANGLQEFQLVLEYRKVLSGKQVFGLITAENAAGKGDAVAGVVVTP